MEQRDAGIVPAANITDSRYQDLMEDPLQGIENIYTHFGLNLADGTKQRMLSYLGHKPKGKFGKLSLNRPALLAVTGSALPASS